MDLGRKILSDDGEHRLMDPPIAGNEFRLVRGMRVAMEVSHPSTRLMENDDPSCRIPGTQLHLPESVESTGSHIAEVQRSASRPAQSPGLRQLGSSFSMRRVEG